MTMEDVSHVKPAATAYEEALTFMIHLHDEVVAGRPLPGASILAIVDRLLEALITDRPVLLGLTAQIPTSNPLASHGVNACILALATAKGLGYQPEHWREVGAAALLHDVGLMKLVDHIAGREVRYADIKRHSYQTLELLDQIPELSRLTLYCSAVTPAHERSEPPIVLHHTHQRTSREEELAKVVRLADLYEALTHPRADGSPLAFAAVRTMLTTQKLFEPRLMKALFDQVGIYPIGTWVLLNTGEVGAVTGIEEGLPLRPQVTLLYDRDGSKLLEPRTAHLTEHPTVFIRQSLAGEPRPRGRA